jgi:hypothetical protein
VVIVYIETNFLIGLTFGQDLAAGALLDEVARNTDLRLAIPSICFMEATATIGGRIHEREAFRLRLNAEMTQLRRNLDSPLAAQFLDQLGKASVTSDGYGQRIKTDFRDVVRRVRSIAQIIPLTKATPKRFRQDYHRGQVQGPHPAG